MDTDRFLNSKWMERARKYVSRPQKMKLLLVQLGTYISKEGLANVKDKLILMYHYLRDVVTGKYKDYNLQKLVVVVGVLIYVVSPFDIIPDILPTGLIDDSSLIIWVLKEVADELENYKIFHNKK